MEITTQSAEETFKLGERLAQGLKLCVPVMLFGNLGAGKTELTKGICAGLGYGGRVLSPTFQLVREYDLASSDQKPAARIYHIDLYRLERFTDIKTIGLKDYFSDIGALVLLEWADRLERGSLPKPRIEVRIVVLSEKTRKFDILNI